MIIKEIIDYLESLAPLSLQEDYDNAGLIVGNRNDEVSGILICLDSTEAVVQEALNKGCNLIIAHHPIVFRGLKTIQGNNYVERVVIAAIKNDIAIYAMHTNLDNVYLNGVNGKICDKLGLENTQILAPKNVDNNLIGSGMIGTLANPLDPKSFLDFVKNSMGAACIRHTKDYNQPIQKVAVCGGSGSFLLSQAMAQGAHAFISADFKYHEFFDAEGKILIADIGHYESEQFTIQLLFDLITNKFSNFAPYCTETVTNPINYY